MDQRMQPMKLLLLILALLVWLVIWIGGKIGDWNGYCDHRQPVESYDAPSFSAVSGLRLSPGELARVIRLEIAAERVESK